MIRTVYFEPVRLSSSVNYKCSSCGKPRKKSICVEHTVNPFNKNEKGSPKSREEVMSSVREEYNKRIAETKLGIICSKCRG